MSTTHQQVAPVGEAKPLPEVLRPQPVVLSIVVPTLNERENLQELIRGIEAALTGVAWELIIVDDDSPDGTSQAARDLYQQDARVRCVRRVGRTGLSSACMEGLLSSSAPWLAVMDADLQHDASLLPLMLASLRSGEADVVVASRYCSQGSTEGWARGRRLISQWATRLSGAKVLSRLTDPMSGYFALRRDVVDAAAPKVSGLGFKILLDILLSAPPTCRLQELPLKFRLRVHGQSKFGPKVAIDFLLMLLDQKVGRWIPVRLLPFALVGLMGVGVHYALMNILLFGTGWSFTQAQWVSTLLTITFNFALNNEVTFAHAALRGARWWRGLASFMAVCGFGAVANVGVASLLFSADTDWIGATAAGVVVSAVWNFAVSSRYTWRPG